MKVRIDLDRRTSRGTCEGVFADVFEVVIEADGSCPQDAIALDEDRGTRVERARGAPHNRGLAVNG